MLKIPHLCLVFLILLGASCSDQGVDPAIRLTAEALYENPYALPDFIAGIEPDSMDIGTSNQEILIFVSQAALWEEGNKAGELQSHIVGSTYFLVNNRRIRWEHASVPSGFATDESGHATDRYGMPIEFRFPVHLEPGFHLIEIVTSSMSGTPFSFQWAISVP